MQLLVQFDIKDPADFLFRVVDPEGITMRDVVETALRQVVGSRPIDDVLTDKKEEVQIETQRLIQSLLDLYEAGINIREVKLQAVNPPAQVSDAFDDVVKAKEDKETTINLADAYEEKVLPTARGEAAEKVEAAEADKSERVNLATGKAESFKAILSEYKKAPDITRQRLYLDAMEEILPNVEKFIVDPGTTHRGRDGRRRVEHTAGPDRRAAVGRPMKLIATLILITVLAAAIVGPQALFVVDETQVAVVTRFGEPIRSLKQPGLYVKTPFIERVQYLDKRLLLFDAPPRLAAHEGQEAAGDRRIRPGAHREPTEVRGDAQDGIPRGLSGDRHRRVRAPPGDWPRRPVRDHPDEPRAGHEPCAGCRRAQAAGLRHPDRGRANEASRLPPGRSRIASTGGCRPSGNESPTGNAPPAPRQDLEKRASVDRQAVVIRSEAQRDADIIRGCGVAEAINIFADALAQDPEFYTFQRSLEDLQGTPRRKHHVRRLALGLGGCIRRHQEERRHFGGIPVRQR